MIREYKDKRVKRKLRLKSKVRGTESRPRLVVFRSLRHIYGQLIDDTKGRSLLSVSDLVVPGSGSPKQRAEEVGSLLAKKALSKGIKEVVFDRSGYKYHGRVKALADGARGGGLSF